MRLIVDPLEHVAGRRRRRHERRAGQGPCLVDQRIEGEAFLDAELKPARGESLCRHAENGEGRGGCGRTQEIATVHHRRNTVPSLSRPACKIVIFGGLATYLYVMW